MDQVCERACSKILARSPHFDSNSNIRAIVLEQLEAQQTTTAASNKSQNNNSDNNHMGQVCERACSKSLARSPHFDSNPNIWEPLLSIFFSLTLVFDMSSAKKKKTERGRPPLFLFNFFYQICERACSKGLARSPNFDSNPNIEAIAFDGTSLRASLLEEPRSQIRFRCFNHVAPKFVVQ